MASMVIQWPQMPFGMSWGVWLLVNYRVAFIIWGKGATPPIRGGNSKAIEVICCGNVLASDDGVGPLIAKRLQSLSLPGDVEVIDAGTPGLSLLDMILGARKVIMVDATITGAKPGTVHKFDLEQLKARRERGLSLHELPLVEALEIAREVYPEKMPDEVVVIGIEAGSIEKPRTGLTKSVEGAIPEAVGEILREINGTSNK